MAINIQKNTISSLLKLRLLLQNLFNAPWPKNFKSEPFIYFPKGQRDWEVIQSSGDFQQIALEDLENMAMELILANGKLPRDAWRITYLDPIINFMDGWYIVNEVNS